MSLRLPRLFARRRLVAAFVLLAVLFFLYSLQTPSPTPSASSSPRPQGKPKPRAIPAKAPITARSHALLPEAVPAEHGELPLRAADLTAHNDVALQHHPRVLVVAAVGEGSGPAGSAALLRGSVHARGEFGVVLASPAELPALATDIAQRYARRPSGPSEPSGKHTAQSTVVLLAVDTATAAQDSRALQQTAEVLRQANVRVLRWLQMPATPAVTVVGKTVAFMAWLSRSHYSALAQRVQPLVNVRKFPVIAIVGHPRQDGGDKQLITLRNQAEAADLLRSAPSGAPPLQAMPHFGGDALVAVNVLTWYGSVLRTKAYASQWPALFLLNARIGTDVTTHLGGLSAWVARVVHELQLNGPACFLFNTHTARLHSALSPDPAAVSLVALLPHACPGFWGRGDNLALGLHALVAYVKSRTA